LAQLPAGPLREPLHALGRAHAVIVTRKSSALVDASAVADTLSRRFPHLGVAICHLALGTLVDCRTSESRPMSSLQGKRVMAIAAVGAPEAFFAQLRAEGAQVDAHPYRDHHAFRADDVSVLAAAAGRREGVVCTLKDAVKLAPLWPAAAAPLWYVSQIAVIERGDAVLDHGLETVLAARQLVTSTAGSAGPSSLPNGHGSSTAD
jgi:tetraacyldisaccharide 4'-kinase